MPVTLVALVARHMASSMWCTMVVLTTTEVLSTTEAALGQFLVILVKVWESSRFV